MSQLIAYLAVRDARSAIAWYTEALGARLVGEAYVMDDDRIGHAELEFSGARCYLSDAHPELGIVEPDPGRVSVTLVLTVPDVDASIARAAEAGARVERPARDEPYGRTGVVVDPFAHRWMLQTPAPGPAEPRPPVCPGDPVHLTLAVPDGARARDFYDAVLGWSAVPAQAPDGWQVENTTPLVGIAGGAERPGVVPAYAVDDIEVAVAAVRTAGGKAGETQRRPYGLSAECRDDQALPFRLAQLD